MKQYGQTDTEKETGAIDDCQLQLLFLLLFVYTLPHRFPQPAAASPLLPPPHPICSCYMFEQHHSVEQIVIVFVVIAASALAALATLSPLPSLASLSSRLLWLHLDVAVGKSIKQKIGCKFLVLITGEISLCRLDFAETQLTQAVYGLLISLSNHDSSWGRRLLLTSFSALSSFFTKDDLLELSRILCDKLCVKRGTL